MSVSNKQEKKAISHIISTSFSQHLVTGSSKLGKLQQFYQEKRLGFTDQISQASKVLTKKIFGTAIRSINRSNNQGQLPCCSNLVSLSFTLIQIAFRDQYVMRLVIQQLNKCHQSLNKMLSMYNPLASVDINALDLQKIFVQIIRKIDGWSAIFNMSEIMRDYSFASQVYSLFLRSVLTKLNYQNAQNLQKPLTNTDEIYSILCDYFDLNIIPHKPGMMKRHNSNKSAQNNQFPQNSSIFLFNNYNLFISIVDNQQFCFGRYYTNQTELLRSQKQLRKSTFQFIMKNKQNKNQRQGQEKKQERKMLIQSGDDSNQEGQPKFGQMLRMSQFQLDLGMSSSGIMLGNQGETPYFNASSNADTPQFGALMDSTRFRKSIDFQTAIKLVQNKRQPVLGTVQQQMNTPPCTDQQKIGFMKQKQSMKTSLSQSKLSKIKVTISPAKKQSAEMKVQQDEDYMNKPRSPPSIQAQKMSINNSVTTDKNLLDSRQVTFNYEKKAYHKNFNGQKNQKTLQKIKQYQYEIGTEQKPKYEKFEKYDINKLKVPQISKKSIIQNNSSQSKFQLKNSFEKQFKQFVNMSVKESQHFLKFQQNDHMEQFNEMQTKKRKNSGARKYSVNEVFNRDISQLHKKHKFVHHSNHFSQFQQYSQMQKTRKTDNNCNNYAVEVPIDKQVWQNTRSDNLHTNLHKQKQGSQRKMGLSSKVINFQIQFNQVNKNQAGKSKSPNRSKSKGLEKKISNQQRRKKILQMKQRIQALRYSKSSNNSKIPFTNNNTSKRDPKIKKINSQPCQVPKQVQSQTIQHTNIQKQKFQANNLVSTLNMKNPDHHLKNEKSPRKNNFPQFLRTSKSRKTIQYSDKQLKNQLNQVTSIQFKGSNTKIIQKKQSLNSEKSKKLDMQKSQRLSNNSPLGSKKQSQLQNPNLISNKQSPKISQTKQFQQIQLQNRKLENISYPSIHKFHPYAYPPGLTSINANVPNSTVPNINLAYSQNFKYNGVNGQANLPGFGLPSQTQPALLRKNSKNSRSQPQLYPITNNIPVNQNEGVKNIPIQANILQKKCQIQQINQVHEKNNSHSVYQHTASYSSYPKINNHNICNSNADASSNSNSVPSINNQLNNAGFQNTGESARRWQYFGVNNVNGVQKIQKQANTCPQGFGFVNNIGYNDNSQFYRANGQGKPYLCRSGVISNSTNNNNNFNTVKNIMQGNTNDKHQQVQEDIARQSCPVGATLNKLNFQHYQPAHHINNINQVKNIKPYFYPQPKVNSIHQINDNNTQNYYMYQMPNTTMPYQSHTPITQYSTYAPTPTLSHGYQTGTNTYNNVYTNISNNISNNSYIPNNNNINNIDVSISQSPTSPKSQHSHTVRSSKIQSTKVDSPPSSTFTSLSNFNAFVSAHGHHGNSNGNGIGNNNMGNTAH